jgi:iron-sulfur cluster repair protein YtfE (RIC family)
VPMEELVRWLRGRHDDLNESGNRLREKVAKTPPGTRDKWIEELRRCLDDFAACFQKHLASEEAGGYLKPVLEARPSLSGAVELLIHEHDELTRIVESIQQAVHQLPPTARLLLRDCCKRIEDLLHWVERHEEHENHLVLYAFSGEDAAQK